MTICATCATCDRELPRESSSFVQWISTAFQSQRTCQECLDTGMCYICHGEGPDDSGQPLRRDCSCKGGSGFVHLSCLCDYARSRQTVLHGELDPWRTCSNCRQPYQGKLAADLIYVREVEELPLFVEDLAQEIESIGQEIINLGQGIRNINSRSTCYFCGLPMIVAAFLFANYDLVYEQTGRYTSNQGGIVKFLAALLAVLGAHLLQRGIAQDIKRVKYAYEQDPQRRLCHYLNVMLLSVTRLLIIVTSVGILAVLINAQAAARHYLENTVTEVVVCLGALKIAGLNKGHVMA